MNILKYLNSQDIAEHCRKIGKEFDAAEAAFIVWINKTKTIKQKHSVWRAIINTIPDVPIRDYRKSVHQFLEEYINVEEKLLNVFFSGGENVGYTISGQGKVYHTFEELMADVPAEKDNLYVRRFNLKYGNNGRFNEELSVEINNEGNPVRIRFYNENLLTATQEEIYNLFIKFGVELPMPFQKGDLVCMMDNSFDKPFIIVDAYQIWDDFFEPGEYDYILSLHKREYETQPNLLVTGYCCNKGEIEKVELMHAYDFVRYRKNPNSEDRFLAHFGKCSEKTDCDSLLGLMHQYRNLIERP